MSVRVVDLHLHLFNLGNQLDQELNISKMFEILTCVNFEIF